MFYVYVLVGSLLYIGFQLNSVYMKPDFKWGLFFKTNSVPTILNLAIGCVIVSVRAELVNIYPVTFLTAIFLGLSGQVIFKKIQESFDSGKTTFIGR
jgi:hypothetical protein